MHRRIPPRHPVHFLPRSRGWSQPLVEKNSYLQTQLDQTSLTKVSPSNRVETNWDVTRSLSAPEFLTKETGLFPSFFFRLLVRQAVNLCVPVHALFVEFTSSFCVFYLKRRRLCYFSHVYFHRDGSCMHFLLYTVLMLSTDSNLLHSFWRWHSSLFESLPILLFEFFPFWLENFVFWSFVYLPLYHGFQILICCLVSCPHIVDIELSWSDSHSRISSKLFRILSLDTSMIDT